jgi:hypothetical protein
VLTSHQQKLFRRWPPTYTHTFTSCNNHHRSSTYPLTCIKSLVTYSLNYWYNGQAMELLCTLCIGFSLDIRLCNACGNELLIASKRAIPNWSTSCILHVQRPYMVMNLHNKPEKPSYVTSTTNYKPRCFHPFLHTHSYIMKYIGCVLLDDVLWLPMLHTSYKYSTSLSHLKSSTPGF